jgi:hypothetical protein
MTPDELTVLLIADLWSCETGLKLRGGDALELAEAIAAYRKKLADEINVRSIAWKTGLTPTVEKPRRSGGASPKPKRSRPRKS